MLFRRLVLCALLVGALAGLFLSAVQRWQVVPLIVAAERFEAAAEAAPQVASETAPAAAAVVAAHGEPGHDHAAPHAHAPVATHQHDVVPANGPAPTHAHAAVPARVAAVEAPGGHAHADHDHDVAEWDPAAGFERTAYTALANVLTATGFALLLLAAMSGVHAWRGSAPGSMAHGLLWGVAGYLSVYLAPALGLPPEIPGAQSAALEARQLWWLLAAAGTAGGLALLSFGRAPWRWSGLLLIALPHLVGAPHHAGLPFAAHPPAAAAELTAIAAQFFAATALANALYWLALGGLAAWAFRRWLAELVQAPLASPGVAAAR